MLFIIQRALQYLATKLLEAIVRVSKLQKFALQSLNFNNIANIIAELSSGPNNEVTNVNICTKHKPNFILRESTSFVNEFEVVSLFRSSRIRKYLSSLFVFVHFIQTLFIKYFV